MKDDYMLKRFEIFVVILIMFTTVMIFSFSAKDAKNSTVQSKAISNTVVDIIEKTTNKTIGELVGESDETMRRKFHGFIRQTAHFLEYSLLGIITFIALFFARHEKKYFTTFAMGVCTIASDELMQFFAVGRAAEWKDAFTDAAGVATGILLGVLLLKLIRKLYIASN